MHERKTLLAWALIGIVLAYTAILILLPVATIVVGALEEGIQPIIESLTSPTAISALRLTAILTVMSSAINVVLGLMVAWVLVRHRFPGKALFNGLVDLPFVMSPVIVGFVVVVLFGRQGWLKNLPFQVAFAFPGMLLVTVFVSLPFVIREIMPVLAAMTPEQEEASLTLGASRFLIARRVVFPGIRHAVITGLVLTLARSLGEFGAAAVAGGGIQGATETATIYVFRMMQTRNDVGAYSMAILLGLISIAVLITMNTLRHRSAGKEDVSHVNPAE